MDDLPVRVDQQRREGVLQDVALELGDDAELGQQIADRVLRTREELKIRRVDAAQPGIFFQHPGCIVSRIEGD